MHKIRNWLSIDGVIVKIWKFTYGHLDRFAGLVYSKSEKANAGMFEAVGEALRWQRRPRVEMYAERQKKDRKPRADISALRPGALVLNPKAGAALSDFLLKFGELLELDCDGGVEYFYNVTNVIDCIDIDKSERRPEGSIAKEVFFEEKLPVEPALFKDPRTVGGRIYANDSAKAILEELINKAGITGAMFAELGPPSPRPRPTP